MRTFVLFAVLTAAFIRPSNANPHAHLTSAECGNILAGWEGREPFYLKTLERLRNSNSFGLLRVAQASLEAKVEARNAAAQSWLSYWTGAGREAEAFPSKEALDLVKAAIQGVEEAREMIKLAKGRDSRPLVDHHAFDGLLAEWLHVVALEHVEAIHSLLSKVPSEREISEIREALQIEKAKRAEILAAFANEDSSTRELTAFSGFVSAGMESQIASAKQYAAKQGIALPSDVGLDLLIVHLSHVSSLAPEAIGTLPQVLERWAVLASELGGGQSASPTEEFILCYLALAQGDVNQTIAHYLAEVQNLGPSDTQAPLRLFKAISLFVRSFEHRISVREHSRTLVRFTLKEPNR